MESPKGKRVTWNKPGHAHELTFSCYRRLRLLDFDPIRRMFLESLGQARRELEYDVWAYVIMPEHVHLLVRPRNREYRIQDFRSAVKGKFASRALSWLRENKPTLHRRLVLMDKSAKAYRRFWQDGPGYDRNLWTPPVIWKSIRYIHGNPVQRKLAEIIDGWPWSSARWYLGIEPVELQIEGCPIVRPETERDIWKLWLEPE